MGDLLAETAKKELKKANLEIDVVIPVRTFPSPMTEIYNG